MRTQTKCPWSQIAHLSVKSHSGIAPDPSFQPEDHGAKAGVIQEKGVMCVKGRHGGVVKKVRIQGLATPGPGGYDGRGTRTMRPKAKKRRTLGWMGGIVVRKKGDISVSLFIKHTHFIPCTAEQFESRVLAPLSQSKKIAQPLSCRLAPNLFIPRGEHLSSIQYSVIVHLMSDPGPYRRWRAWRPALERRRRRPWRSPPPMDRGGDRFDGSDRGDRAPMDRGGFGDRGGAAAFAFTFWPRWPWIG